MNCTESKVKTEDGNSTGGTPPSVGIYIIGNDSTLESKRPNPQGLEAKLRKENKPHRYRKWFVLAAAFFAFFCSSFFPHMSVLNIQFLDEFGRSQAETALVQSVSSGMLLIPGLIMGIIVAEYGGRKSGIFGGLLVALGLAFSFFATSILYLVITVGFVAGTGASVTFLSASTSVGEYFHDGSKFVALAFMSTGIGFGAMVFPYLLDFLISSFGWRGSILIVGGLMANMIPFFAVCKPLHVGIKQSKGNSNTCNDCSFTSSIRKWYKNQCLYGTRADSYTLNGSLNSTISQNQDSCPNNSFGFMFKMKVLLRQKAYVLFTIAMLFTIPVINSIMIFHIKFLQSKGFDKETSIFLYFCVTISSTFFTLVPGICKYIPHLSVLLIPAFYTGSGAVICALLPHATSYIQHVVLMVGLGMVLGGIVTVASMTTMKLVGLKYYTLGFGILMTSLGIGNICCGPISGYMIDVTGSHSLSLYAVSVAFGVATFLLCLATILRKFDGDNIRRVEEHFKRKDCHTKKQINVLPGACN